MKFNIEVEIDWLREGDNIDDVVKQSIIDGVVRKLSGGLIKQITDKAMDRVNKKLDELVLNLFDSFIESGVTITNSWGEVIRGVPGLSLTLPASFTRWLWRVWCSCYR